MCDFRIRTLDAETHPKGLSNAFAKHSIERRQIGVVVAIDNKLFYRSFQSPFWAQLGVAIRVQDQPAFDSSYRQTVDSLNTRYGLNPPRKAPDSRTLYERLGEAQSVSYVRDFVNGIRTAVAEVYTFHSIVPPSRIPAVSCYGGSVSVKPVEFVKSLTGTYTHCMFWKLGALGLHNNEELALLDHFEGDRTLAWQAIEQAVPNLKVHYSGDNCNPMISSADLLCKFFDDELRRQGLRLGGIDLQTVFASTGFQGRPIFLDDLGMMVPRFHTPIDSTRFTHHPMVFVFGSGLVKSEQEVVRAVGTYDRLANFAHDRGAAMKFFDYDNPGRDARMMQAHDIFVALGEKGTATANYIRTDLGIDVDVRTGADIR